jgi:copper chaperone
METTAFSVQGMNCDGCAKGIGAALRFLPGVASARVRHDPGEAMVTYDPASVSIDQLKREIEELGYAVAIDAHR